MEWQPAVKVFVYYFNGGEGGLVGAKHLEKSKQQEQ